VKAEVNNKNYFVSRCRR